MRYYALNKQFLYPVGTLRKIQSLSKLLSDPYTPNFVSFPQLFNLIYSNLWYWIDNELIWVPKFVSVFKRESKRRKWIWASIFQLSQIVIVLSWWSWMWKVPHSQAYFHERNSWRNENLVLFQRILLEMWIWHQFSTSNQLWKIQSGIWQELHINHWEYL